MKPCRKRLATGCLATVVSFSLAAAPVASGSAPSNVSDLVNEDSDWGGRQLRSRGYTRIEAHSHSGYTTEYWWSNGVNTCLKLLEVDGKYNSINATSSTDCNQYHKEATDNSNMAAMAIAAAAILGVAALAHKSHERHEKHSQDEKSVAEFDRGYRDGLHHERYHNYNNTSAYSDGYNAGQRKRDQQTQHRSHDGHHSGYHAYVSLNDLVGVRGASADSALRSRGFNDTGGYKQGQRSITLWYNARSHQCVKAVTKAGRIKRFQNIAEGNCT